MSEPPRIAQVAPLYERVPPRLYGGTERVVNGLTEELVRRGHDVTLFASGDSDTKAHLVGPVSDALRLASATDALSAHIIELGQVFDRAGAFDVIHCHVDYLAFPFARRSRTPTVHTMHGRLDLPFLRPVFQQFHDVPVVSISDAQRAPLADLDVAWEAPCTTVSASSSISTPPRVETISRSWAGTRRRNGSTSRSPWPAASAGGFVSPRRATPPIDPIFKWHESFVALAWARVR